MEDIPERVSDEQVNDLRRRLRAFRQVPLVTGVGWDRGTDAGYLAELVDHWATRYDWRAAEDEIRSWPWQVLPAGRTELRLIHQRAELIDGSTDAADAPVVVLLHGWPDSVLRFSRLLPLLSDFTVVVPALPGYPFSAPVTEPGMSAVAMAECVAQAMAGLGYHRYVVSGGDIGSAVAEALARAHPDRVAALHLTDVPYRHLFTIDAEDLDADERDYQQRGQRWQLTEGSYALQQSTKPHTLAAGLGDSPAGLAAWIVEKLRSWSDSHGDVESVFSRDELLTWVSAYWFTRTIGTSFLPYVERGEGSSDHLEVPTAVTVFPKDLVPAPRSFAERIFDVRSFDVRPDGGHFAAWERPEVYADAVRGAVALAE